MTYAPIWKTPFPEAPMSPSAGQGRVLVVAHPELFREMLADLIREMGCLAETAAGVAEGGAKAAGGLWDLVLVDLRLPDGSGLELLPVIQRLPQPPPVVLLLSAGDSLAFPGGRAEVAGFLRRDLPLREARALLRQVMAWRGNRSPAERYLPLRLEEVVGRSAAMQPCFEALAHAAVQEAPVLILGEAGSGRALFARLVHAHSSRRRGPWVSVSATSLAGQEGAASRWPDLDRQAQGGTLFIRGLETLNPPAQQSLASFLSRRREPAEAGFRVIAAGTPELLSLVREGAFARDLWQELAGVTIHLPPLRERREDIPEMTLFHLLRLCPPGEWKGMGPDFLEALVAYPWPGNVAELVAVLREALRAAGADPVLRAWHLPPRVRPARCPRPDEASSPPPESLPATGVSFKEYRRRVLAQAEKAYMEALMTRAQHNIKEACRLSALSLPRLYALLKKYHLRA